MRQKLLLAASVAALALSGASAAYADTVSQITAALSQAISQRVGDKVSQDLGGNQPTLKNSAAINFGAAGFNSSSSYFALASIDTWSSPDFLWGGAFNYATDDSGSFNAYGGSGYLADVFSRSDRTATYLIIIGNVTGISSSMGGGNQTAYSGTADLNWQMRGESNVTRLDGGYSGSGESSTSGVNSVIFANIEEDLLRGDNTPYLDGGIAESFPNSGSDQTSGHVGAGWRHDWETTTLNLDGGAAFANDTGWYANASLKKRF